MVWLVIHVLAPFSLGYFFSYLYRAVNAVVAPDLVRDIGLSASELGLLTAAYLLGFAGFQLPLGVLLDRFGPRKVQATLVCVAATGALIFSFAGGIVGLIFARALIGVGSAGGLMAGFKAVALWVPEQRRALANACIMAVGGLGIMTATVPAELAVQAVGWRGLFIGLAALTLVVAVVIFTLVPDQPERSEPEPLNAQIKSVAGIYSDKAFWRLAPLVATTAGVHIGIQTLWAGPWMRDVAGLDRAGVAEQLGLMAIGFLAGTLLSGAVADWLGRRGVGLLTVMTGFVLVYMATEVAIIMEVPWAVPAVWFVFGMVGQAGILAYPWLASYFGAHLAGRANTAMNLLVFSTAFISQSAIGFVIDLWPQTSDGGYAREGYQAGFGLFLGLQIIALFWFWFSRPPAHPGGQD
ncbi:MAG: MFS transporter [Hyphomicrobiales bacterium]